MRQSKLNWVRLDRNTLRAEYGEHSLLVIRNGRHWIGMVTHDLGILSGGRQPTIKAAQATALKLVDHDPYEKYRERYEKLFKEEKDGRSGRI